METPFIGGEALTGGVLTRHQLRSRHTALYPGVYVPADAEVSARLRAEAAWLWSRRRGILAGRSAAAMHGTKWLDPRAPAELLYGNRHPPRGMSTWADAIADDELTTIDGMVVTTPVRTALDLACRYPQGPAVAAIDALANATHLKVADVELLAGRYRGRRGIRAARRALALVDPGAESPRETWLRLLVVRNGFPPPTTQIPVRDRYGVLVAVLDMGWEDIKVALDYEGAHHRGPIRFNKDIHRHDAVTELGWTDIRVTCQDTEGGIICRLQAAWDRRM
ncbi:hypothetical protein H7I41_18460 [Mycobacterium manitobense]|uniref:AbiEi antitoxin C-terminal domain-containing protein n=1 Tax=[Mycobacterium] manitobense TaxID=190147 RepID=A0A9X3BWN1_9MYCO|nr:hypothetical protein [[Mycobacterium] manitobense]MCV7171901.1 hypothetical protein [[Mycobacterium] manitobense]